MSDTYTLELKNFRSIRDVSMDIAPLTVVYGPNGAGKSSLIYGLLTLKNFLTNPEPERPQSVFVPYLELRRLQRGGVGPRRREDGLAFAISLHSRGKVELQIGDRTIGRAVFN